MPSFSVQYERRNGEIRTDERDERARGTSEREVRAKGWRGVWAWNLTNLPHAHIGWKSVGLTAKRAPSQAIVQVMFFTIFFSFSLMWACFLFQEWSILLWARRRTDVINRASQRARLWCAIWPLNRLLTDNTVIEPCKIEIKLCVILFEMR